MSHTLIKYYVFITDIVYLLGSDYPNHKKFRILYHYLRLSILTLFFRNQLTEATINVLGFKITGESFSSLYVLYGEIFVKGIYYFKATTTKTLKIIDCGANIGMATLFFKYMYPNAEIIAIEPDPLAYEYLVKNINNNKLADIKPMNVAVGAHELMVDFYRTKTAGSLMVSTNQDWTIANEEKIKIQAVTVSSLIDDAIDYLKIDVEGAEVDVLNDIDKQYKFNHIKNGFIEYHHNYVTTLNFSMIMTILDKHKYSYQIDAQSIPLRNLRDHQNVQIVFYQN